MYTISNDVHLNYIGNELIISNNKETILLNSFQAKIVECISKTGKIDNSLKEIVEITGKSNEEVLIVLEKFLFNLEQRGHISRIKTKEDVNTLKIYGKKGEYYPIKLTIELTNTCNLFCEHCFKECSPNKKNNIPYNQLIMFLNDMRGKVREIQITGGEPMLYKQFNDLITYLRSNFEIITMTTTATKITSKNINILKMLDYIQVSLYSHIPSEHNKITGSIASYDATLRGVKLLVSNGIKFGIANVLRKSFIEKLDEYIIFLINNNIKEINFGEVGIVGRGRYLSDDWYFTKEQIESLVYRIFELKKKYQKKINISSWSEEEKLITILGNDRMMCGAGLLEWTIDENGIIKPCVLFPNNKFNKINLKNYKEFFRVDQNEYVNDGIMSWEEELNSVGLSTARICSAIYDIVKEIKYEENNI